MLRVKGGNGQGGMVARTRLIVRLCRQMTAVVEIGAEGGALVPDPSRG